jgi:hypothetical protein
MENCKQCKYGPKKCVRYTKIISETDYKPACFDQMNPGDNYEEPIINIFITKN